MSPVLDFQNIILKLQQYWAEQGCLIGQPYYTQVGAGTNNPATMLRVLGPEPWRVAYVEPSVRPDDARYGDNPNRLQMHYQFQVILKPDPGNPQELYLRSLEAIGIDPRRHDIRFVEDNWQSPALGMWGLGWEVWCDGQEITQFTYFQQVGGVPAEPVSVELTYGLERISMALQGVRHFKDIRWNQQITYGDLNMQGEQEHSRYYFEIADVDRLWTLFKLNEAEANAALDQDLVLPAYDHVLKCSHLFNVLDTRGAVGVTERQVMFGKMRDLSRRIADRYVRVRESLGFPLGRATARTEKKIKAVCPGQGMPAARHAHDLLLEIGSEELPAGDLNSAVDQLKERLPGWLDELRLTHGEMHVAGTPRRLVVMVKDLAPYQPDRTLELKGPPASRAFNEDGTATPAGEGFARGKGLTAKDLVRKEIDGGTYAVAIVQETGRDALSVLAEALPGWIGSIKFDKSMRWDSDGTAFSRPVRWLLALYGDQVIPFNFAGLSSGCSTRGLRFIEPAEKQVFSVGEYHDYLEKQGIILDPLLRKEAIRKQVAAKIKELGGTWVDRPDLEEEVSNLVEAPTAFIGKFDESHLQLPGEVLISVMLHHQKYFPVQQENGTMMPYFIGVRNGDARHLEVVADGNAQVIEARFADAAFFIKQDEQHKLEEFLPRLDTLTFQKQLGSMGDKSRRIEKLAQELAGKFELDQKEQEALHRAAKLCKADLVTHMVIEMTSLQGVIGRHYAEHSGESRETAQAIAEHYLPRYAGDRLPEGKSGLVLSIADRLDSLIGLFASGMAPTGTKDPFALRRAALGLVQVLIGWDKAFDIRAGLELAAAQLPIDADGQVIDECLQFVVGRLQSHLQDRGYRYDAVAAVLAEQGGNPAGARKAIEQLQKWISRADWNKILPAYARCVRITRDQKQVFKLKAERLVEEQEKALYNELLRLEASPRGPGSIDDLLNAFIPAIPGIDEFFDAVMVMAEDASLRENRLALLQRVAGLTAGVVDLSQLEGF